MLTNVAGRKAKAALLGLILGVLTVTAPTWTKATPASEAHYDAPWVYPAK